MPALILLVFLYIVAGTAAAVEPDRIASDYRTLLHQPFYLLPYNGSYLLPVSYNDVPNQSLIDDLTDSEILEERGTTTQKTESEFQISFALLVHSDVFFGHDIFVAYTQHSWWQIYNQSWSRPFRETNYAPEVFFRSLFEEPVSLLGGHLLAYDLGFIHQSNGQTQSLSRSWNRFFFKTFYQNGNLVTKLTIWKRLQIGLEDDDNPNIEKYLGYGEVRFNYSLDSYGLGLRLIPGTSHYSSELIFTMPIIDTLEFYSSVSYGYGLSLQDYKHHSEKIAMGITISNPLNIILNTVY